MAAESTAAKSRWWDGDASQRYWMEVVHVEKYGTELVAPEESRHDRMHDVRVGDIVLHWVSKKNPNRLKPGLYGASRVAGELQPKAATWKGQPANRIPLTGFKALREPYLLPDLRAKHQEDILGILGRLTQDLERKPKQNVYFPFNRHPTVGLKPNEGYLFKMPRQVIDAVPNLLPDSDWGAFDVPLVAPPVSGQNGVMQRYAGFCADPVLKKAIETHAVRQAIAHYEAAGYTVEDVGAYRPFDLEAVRGDEVRRVEVKGSQGHVQKVILTRNEVANANEFDETDLVVVAEIQWERHIDGTIVTDDGLMNVYPDWKPSPENLVPLSYEYCLD